MRSVPAGFLLLCALASPTHALPSQADCDADGSSAVPHAATAARPEAGAVWLNESLLRWPGIDAHGRFRLHHSADGAAVAAPGHRVKGSDGALDLDVYTEALPAVVEERFRHVGPGVTLNASVPVAALRDLHRQQLLLVQEDADGRVLRATRMQSAAALDALYAAAAEARLGVTVDGGRTAFALWAPTARSVSLCLYEDGAGAARALEPLQRDDETGVWTTTVGRDLSGR